MIAELGLAMLWLAGALVLLQLVTGAFALTARGRELSGIVRPVAVVQGILCGGAFLALITLFLRTDLSVKLVATNSHSLKPVIFKLAGTWGNHEGSMLLWVTVMALCGGFIALFESACATTPCWRRSPVRPSSASVSMPSCCCPPTRSSGCPRDRKSVV